MSFTNATRRCLVLQIESNRDAFKMQSETWLWTEVSSWTLHSSLEWRAPVVPGRYLPGWWKVLRCDKGTKQFDSQRERERGVERDLVDHKWKNMERHWHAHLLLEIVKLRFVHFRMLSDIVPKSLHSLQLAPCCSLVFFRLLTISAGKVNCRGHLGSLGAVIFGLQMPWPARTPPPTGAPSATWRAGRGSRTKW